MTTINDITDLHRILVDHPEWREQIRTTLLTDELLRLPQRFAEYTAMSDARFERIETNLETLTSRVDTLTIRMDELTAVVREMATEMVGMRRDISRIHDMHKIEHAAMHRFRGNYASDATRRQKYRIGRAFAQQQQVRRCRVAILSDEEREDLLFDNEDAIDQLGLPDSIWDTFIECDLLAAVLGAPTRRAKPMFYIAVEASYSAGMDDYDRAVQHAKVLRCATGLTAFPIVSGVKLANDDMAKLVTENIADAVASASDDDSVIYWYRLNEDALEPEYAC